MGTPTLLPCSNFAKCELIFIIFFTGRLLNKFAIKSIPNIPPHLANAATLPCEMSEFKKCRTKGLNKSNCHVRLSYSKSSLKYTCLVMIPFSDKDTLSSHAKNILSLCATATAKKKMPRQKAAVNQWTISHWQY